MSTDQPGAETDRGDAGEKVGVFQSHPWLIPVTVVVSIVLAFVAMVLLTSAAGGSTPFGN